MNEYGTEELDYLVNERGIDGIARKSAFRN